MRNILIAVSIGLTFFSSQAVQATNAGHQQGNLLSFLNIFAHDYRYDKSPESRESSRSQSSGSKKKSHKRYSKSKQDDHGRSSSRDRKGSKGKHKGSKGKHKGSKGKHKGSKGKKNHKHRRHARIDISKEQEGPDSREFTVGSDVSFAFTLTNNGKTALENINVSDIQAPQCDHNVAYLAVDETYSYECVVQFDPLGSPNVTATRRWYDDFSSGNIYSGDHGNEEFTGPWIEIDPKKGGAKSGLIRVDSGARLALSNKSSSSHGKKQSSIARTADLSGLSSATLNFEWVTSKYVKSNDGVTVEISSDGGNNYSILHENLGKQLSPVTESFDITPHLSDETTIRFRVSHDYGSKKKTFYLNHLEIAGEPNGLPDDFVNEACVSAMGVNGKHAEDCDTSTVTFKYPEPVLEISKQERGDDVRSFPADFPVEFEINVTNNGQTNIEELVISDPLAPACEMVLDELNAGESFSFTCTATVEEMLAAAGNTGATPGDVDRVTNEICVSAVDEYNQSVEDCDKSTVNIAKPMCERFATDSVPAGANQYGVWLDGHGGDDQSDWFFVTNDATFTEYSHGVARLTGSITSYAGVSYNMDVVFSDYTDDGVPKEPDFVPVNTEEWVYYTQAVGQIGPYKISLYALNFQIGYGANLNDLEYGAAAWFSYDGYGEIGDFNLQLENACHVIN